MLPLTIYTSQKPTQNPELLTALAQLTKQGYFPIFKPLQAVHTDLSLKQVNNHLAELQAQRLVAEENGQIEFWHFYHSLLTNYRTHLQAGVNLVNEAYAQISK